MTDGGPTQHDGPHVGLDQLLEQLVERARDVQEVQERLGGLLSANRAIASDLDVTTVLRRIIEAAVGWCTPQYGALGVIAPEGRGLEQFIHVGMDDATVETIGQLPEGKGLLGLLIEQPHAIRLEDLSHVTNARSASRRDIRRCARSWACRSASGTRCSATST